MLKIRPAEAGDVHQMLEMLRESAVDQGYAPEEVVVSEADLLADGFGPSSRFRAVIADVEGTAAGLALYFISYSTWGSRLVLYLEDLYVRSQYRRSGIARALLERLGDVARAEGCRRMQWLVHRDNERAIRLYESFGAEVAHDWVLMSIKGPALDA